MNESNQSIGAGMGWPRPRIGITAEGRAVDNSIILPGEYLDGVRRAGGEPVLLAPWEAASLEKLKSLEGLLLAGGGDIHPEQYGSPGHAAIYEVDTERDAGELEMVQHALTTGLPVLGICRGAQLVNVAMGGTLHEHLPDVLDGTVRHRAEPPGAEYHKVHVAPASKTEAAMGAGEAVIASWHHQSVRDVAPGLVVTAWAEDGCVEAVEAIDHPWLVAVQWHPELTASRDPSQQRLFDALVVAARLHGPKQTAGGQLPLTSGSWEGRVR